jgi:hypothetical protein
MEHRLHYQLIASVLAFAGVAALAGPVAPPATAIKQFPLDERTVYHIAIGRDVPTTLMFPSALTAIEGANVSSSAEAVAPVLLAYTPGQHFFSVRALEAGARGAVNVVWKGRTIVIRFQDSTEPLGSVTFIEEDFAGRTRAPQRRLSTENLLGLLDQAKGFALVAQQYPETVRQIEHAAPGNVCFYRDFQVTVEEVFRFDPEDTLVFRVRLENRADTDLHYLPQRIAARVGLSIYYPAIVDASGVVPAKATTTAYFAITGTPTGGRANLSIKNTFSIVVSRVDRDAKLIVPE